jgi:hypothetical protein
MAMLVLQVCARHYTGDKHEDVKKVNELIRAMNDEYSQHWYDLTHSQAAAELQVHARVASWVYLHPAILSNVLWRIGGMCGRLCVSQ